MASLKEKIKEYDETLLRSSQVQALGQASVRNHRSLFNWIWSTNPRMLAPPFYDFMYHDEDFISAVGTRSSYFREGIQNHVNKHPKSPLKYFLKTKHEKGKSSEDRVNYYSNRALEYGGRFLLVLALVAFLLIPVLLLFLLEMNRGKMAMIASVAIVSFALFLSALPRVGEYEFFVGTATYGAVLIMFLGNISQCGTA